MRHPLSWLAGALTLLLASPLTGQGTSAPAPSNARSGFNFVRIAPPAEPGAIPLYPADQSPPRKPTERWAAMGGQRFVRNVTRPTITPFLPDLASATGAAVIVAPGGGYMMLSMDNEGWPVARWLAEHGIAAFVLKYRLNETPDDEQAFQRAFGERMSGIAKGEPPPLEPRAVKDALRAIQMVRSQASKWAIDPARVGMIGFSAGARTALQAALSPIAEERPAFFASIYGSMAAVPVPHDAPPMFNALALDDPLYGRMGFGIVESWQKAGRPVEFHAYEKGSHGFGLGRPGTTTTLVMEQFHAWLKSRGLLAHSAR